MALRMWVLVVCWALFLWFVGWRIVRGLSVSFAIGATLAFLLLTWQTYEEYTWQHNEYLYTQAVEPITGPGKTVHCQRVSATWFFAGGELGHVMYNSDGSISPEAWLTYETCHQLGQWMTSDKTKPTLDEVTAVHVLSHEAQHLAGIKNEAIAECRAMMQDSAVAERLGATPAEASALQTTYITKVYPLQSSDYKTQDCPVGNP